MKLLFKFLTALLILNTFSFSLVFSEELETKKLKNPTFSEVRKALLNQGIVKNVSKSEHRLNDYPQELKVALNIYQLNTMKGKNKKEN